MLCREQIEERRATLVKAHERMVVEMNAIRSNLNGIAGAIGECDHWLKQFGDDDPAACVTPPADVETETVPATNAA